MARTDVKMRTLALKLDEADRALVDRAAVRCGRSRTGFVRDAAVCAAQGVLMGGQVKMSPDGFAHGRTVSSGPAAPVPEIVALAQRAASWERG